MFQSTTSDILALIEGNKLLKAAKKMLALWEGQEYRNRCHLQIRRINENESQFNSGIIGFEECSTNRNRISLALLDLASEAEKDSEEAGRTKDIAEKYYDFGNVQLKNKDYLKAILYFTKAIHIDSRNANAYLERGVAKCAMESFEESKQDLSIAIELEPTQPFAYFNRGIVFYHLNELINARSDWQKVKDLG